MRIALVAAAALIAVSSGITVAADAAQNAKDPALAAAVSGDWRPAEHKARDKYRHPEESLRFWGLRPGMAILEIQPGAASWWTEILAPYARATGGKYYATGPDLNDPKLSDGARKTRTAFETKYAGQPDRYGKVEIVNWGANSAPLPANTFDLILTARSIHGWIGNDMVEKAFSDFHRALKPGGILAVEQHRADPKDRRGAKELAETGYVTEAFVIEQARKAGFELDGRSDINANPKDTKDHPFGVWTLPPTRQSVPYGSGKSADPSFDHSKYDAIGESDRMTLRFRKPG